MFDTFAGLPLHPFVVHAVVVLLPLSAIGLVLLVLLPRFRRTYGWLVVGGLGASAVAALIARQSGEELEHRIGDVGSHGTLGTITTIIAWVLFAVATAWWMLWRQEDAHGGRPSVAAGASGWVGVLLAVAAIVAVALTGHSGASEVWSDVGPAPTASAPTTPGAGVAPGTTPSTPPSSVSATPSPSPTPATYTMADVATHASAESCWAVVDGSVYDLTTWVGRHPGGRARILGLCGTDATQKFHAQHGTAKRPNATLTGFRIGTLA